MKERTFDVAVVGAGPAGSTAARHCAMRDLSTLLLEKERMPREKPCAGGLTVAAARELGFSLPERLIERRCRGMKLRFRRTENTITFDRDVIYMVRRSMFDEFLAGKAAEAGAELHEAEACTGIEAGIDHVLVSTDKGRYRAKILIGSDGYFSAAAKVVRPPFSNVEVWVCVIAEIPLSSREIEERMGNHVEIDYGAIDGGYAWLFFRRPARVAQNRRFLFSVSQAFPRTRGVGPEGTMPIPRDRDRREEPQRVRLVARLPSPTPLGKESGWHDC